MKVIDSTMLYLVQCMNSTVSDEVSGEVFAVFLPVILQVEDIDKKFRKLNHLKLNNWEEERAEVEKVAKKKTVKVI